jgi:isocitrate dehydrogenase
MPDKITTAADGTLQVSTSRSSDFARLMEGATEVKTSEFASAIVERL